MCVVCVHVSLIKGLQTFTVCISKFRCKYLGIMCSSFTHTDNCVSIGKNSIGELFIIFTLQSLSHVSVAGLRQLVCPSWTNSLKVDTWCNFCALQKSIVVIVRRWRTAAMGHPTAVTWEKAKDWMVLALESSVS